MERIYAIVKTDLLENFAKFKYAKINVISKEYVYKMDHANA